MSELHVSFAIFSSLEPDFVQDKYCGDERDLRKKIDGRTRLGLKEIICL